MNYERFIQNVIDQIKEAQIKLGYAYETTRLYYPTDSLGRLLNAEDEKERLLELLKSDLYFQNTKLGKIAFGGSKERIEVCILPEGAKYIHEKVETPVFLEALIQLFNQNHHCKIEEIEALFQEYSNSCVVKKMPEGEDFDYVLHFEDEKPDAYYYCIKMEMGHTIYHRFCKEDYLFIVSK